MGNYQTNAQRDYRYKMIAKAEGDQCIVCYVEDHVKKGPPRYKLILEHADNDSTNWAWENLHLCCYSHNKKMEWMPVIQKIAMLQAYTDHLEREREREGLPTRTSVFKDETDFEGSSTEIQLNRRYHAKWLRYVTSRIREEGTVSKKALILSAAKKAGCSKQTSTNYMEVETSEEGSLVEEIDHDGDRIVTFRNLPDLSVFRSTPPTKKKTTETQDKTNPPDEEKKG